MRREWQSYCFKAFDEKELPSLSILDFDVIPLKKPRHQRVKNQDEGRRTFNLFTNKNLRIGLKRASARRRRIRVTVDGI